MSERLRTVSPVDGRVLVERPLLSEGELARALERARRAQAAWRAVPIAERVAVWEGCKEQFLTSFPEFNSNGMDAGGQVVFSPHDR